MFIIINYDNIKRRGVFMNIKDLKIVQSNISLLIQNLKNKFATKLFYRYKYDMILISNGEVLNDYANKILSVSEEMEQVLNQKDNPRGKLDIASVETVIKLPL